MRHNPSLRQRLLSVFTLIILSGLLAGCAPRTAGISVWIDVPLDGLILPGVQAINIDGHAASPGGISRIEIWIDGALLANIDNPPTDDGLASFHLDWTPASIGDYTIQAVAFSPDGSASQPDSARVAFGGLVEDVQPLCAVEALVAPLLVSPADGATLAPDPLLAWSYPDGSCHPHSYKIDISEDASFADLRWGFGTLDHLETSRSWPLAAGRCYYWRVLAYSPDGYGPASGAWRFCVAEAEVTVTETPTPTPPPALEPIIQFWAEPAQIQAGACTTIKWHVENVQSITFGGVQQDFDGSYKDCLCKSERYSLTVTSLDGTQEKRTVDISVSGVCETPTPEDNNPPPAADTTPPPTPELVVPGNGLTLSCRGSQSMAWLPVSDPSGIMRYEVQIERHAGDGSWQTVSGSPFSINDKTMSIPVECGWTYRWRVHAVDGAGNIGGWSGWFQYTVTLE
ncbi:MAG: Ig-like domain-containing protein [Anaerolineae bacterium]|nr:Ig-like domain-containing protein [Anaerolineae bacterium]